MDKRDGIAFNQNASCFNLPFQRTPAEAGATDLAAGLG